MMKGIFIFFVCAACSLQFAFASSCPRALPTNDPMFCQSFVIAAQCRCLSAGYPNFICHDLRRIYKLMVFFYFSQKSACQHQQETSFRICMDDWNCYRYGGKDSRGQLCSKTGKACY